MKISEILNGNTGHCRSGAALVSVLFLFLILSVFLISMHKTFENQLYGERNNYNFYKIQYALEGVKEKILYDAGAGKNIIKDKPASVQIGGSEINYILDCENRKTNINRVKKEELIETAKKIIEDEGEAQVIADSILDWIDGDDLERLNGAEKNYYKTNGYDYEPANAGIRNIFELSKIRGLREKKDYIFQPDAPCFEKYYTSEIQVDSTGNSNDTKIDISSASDTVLKSELNLDEKQMAEITKLREKNNLTVKTFSQAIGSEKWISVKSKIEIFENVYSLKIWNIIKKYEPQLLYYIIFSEKEEITVKKKILINLLN
ncbi:MAG TPA: type II secretion system protein GspK [bacterium]|nr:type II secretion system protein GspK [bacterium]HPN30716.1 type II secretion system protein GspK [bacterium]